MPKSENKHRANIQRITNPRGNVFLHAVQTAAFACLLAIVCGCGGGVGTPSPIGDHVPPAAAASLSASEHDGQVSLSWTNPADADFKTVIIRRGAAAYPVNAYALDSDTDAGVYSGTGTSFTDTGLENKTTYYYTIFTCDSKSNCAQARASVTTEFLPFALIVIPDIQYVTLGYPTLLQTITQWMADNAEDMNIAYVLQEGDITHKNTTPEWENAAAGFNLLDDKVPYALAVGNHDMSGGTTAKFNTAFPVTKFEAWPTFGGVYESGKLNNSYHLFHAGGTDWLILSLIYNPDDAVLDWAASVIEDYPDRRVIILTHAYLGPDSERTGIGEDVWSRVARKYKGVEFVFNGHYTDGETGRLTSTGDNGNSVYQMFANYQTRAFGGLGLLRIVACDPGNNRVSVRTYSPWLQTYETDDGNQFTYENVAFGPP